MTETFSSRKNNPRNVRTDENDPGTTLMDRRINLEPSTGRTSNDSTTYVTYLFPEHNEPKQ